MKKYIVARFILIALIILWMDIIFGFSAATDVESQGLSDKITIKVVHIIHSDYDNLSLREQKKIFDLTSFMVRKTGHLGEYTILGILVSLFLLTFEKIRSGKTLRSVLKIQLLGTAMWVFVYAISDEFHQGFVKGRSPQIMDVLIDTIGGVLGCLLVFWCVTIISKRIIKSSSN